MIRHFIAAGLLSLLLSGCGGGGSSSGGGSGSSGNSDGSIQTKTVSFNITKNGVACSNPDSQSESDSSKLCTWLCGIYQGRDPTGVSLFFLNTPNGWVLNKTSFTDTGQKCS